MTKKIISFSEVSEYRAITLELGLKLVVTNGCWDLLHVGHLATFEAARERGDIVLVGVNDDAGVRLLKGEGRPINNDQDRARMLNAMAVVDLVCIFPGSTATAFLKAAQPDVYVKGGDYTLETLNPDERQVLADCGATIVFVPLTPWKSTTGIIQKL